jgi:hypothetical protein
MYHGSERETLLEKESNQVTIASSVTLRNVNKIWQAPETIYDIPDICQLPDRKEGDTMRSILRKKYRRAVGTHNGPTRILQAGFSLCHQRDGRAGTKILQLVSASDDRTKALISDYGQTGLPEQGQRRRIRLSRRTVLRDYGPKEAASSRRRAVGTTGPFQGLLADREQRTQLTTLPGQQYLQGTTGRTDQLDGYAGVHSGKRTTRPRDLLGADQRVSPMLGILGQDSTRQSTDKARAG